MTIGAGGLAHTAPLNSSPNRSISICSKPSCASCPSYRREWDLLMTTAKILAVDDEADFEALIRQRFRRQIRAQEFEFRFAHHGEEALAVLDEEPDIELMLLDINMPVMDGLTLLGEL